MPLIAKDSGSGDFAPLPSGMHHAVCCSVVDLGVQPSYNPQFAPKRQVAITWEVPGETILIEGKQLPRAITAIYTLSLSPKSKLRPMLESWRGRPFTEEEKEGFDVTKLLGANCFLNVVHNVGKDKQGQPRTYANVASVNPLPKGTARMTAINPHVSFVFEDGAQEAKIPDEVPEWIAKLIQRSEQWQDLTAPDSGSTRRNPATDDGSAFGSRAGEPEDEVPF